MNNDKKAKRIVNRVSILIIVILLFSNYFCLCAFAETGKVIKCLNGDSYIVMNGINRINIKLWGVECPQKGQPWSEQATNYVKSLILNKNIEYQTKIQTSKNELYSIVKLNDNRCLNIEILKRGYGWWNYIQEKSNPEYRKAELSARYSLKEIWSDNSSIPPWKWREYISLINHQNGKESEFNLSTIAAWVGATISLLLLLLKFTAKPKINWENYITKELSRIVVTTKITNTGRKHIYIKDQEIVIVQSSGEGIEKKSAVFDKNILHIDGDSAVAKYEVRENEIGNIEDIYIKNQKTDKSIYMPKEILGKIK